MRFCRSQGQKRVLPERRCDNCAREGTDYRHPSLTPVRKEIRSCQLPDPLGRVRSSKVIRSSLYSIVSGGAKFRRSSSCAAKSRHGKPHRPARFTIRVAGKYGLNEVKKDDTYRSGALVILLVCYPRFSNGLDSLSKR